MTTQRTAFFDRPSDWEPHIVGQPSLGEVPELGSMLAAGIREGGSSPAVTDQEGTLSHSELDQKSGALAAQLQAVGVKAGDAVVIHCELSRWAVVAMLAVLRIGAQYVPVDTAFPLQRRATIIANSKAKVAVVGSEAAMDIPGDVEFETILRADVPHLEQPADVTLPSDLPQIPAYTLFTSGSSGIPKGVVVSRHGLACSTTARLLYFCDTPAPVYLLCVSISFDMSAGPLYHTLAAGGHVVIPSPVVVDTNAILTACEQHRATFISVIPSLYRILLASDDRKKLSSLEAVIVAGEPCPPALVREHLTTLPATTLYNEYGPTECTIWTTIHQCRESDGTTADVPIGLPVPGTSAYVRNEDGAPTTRGEIGELWLGGPQVALGYSNAGPANAPLWRRDGIYRTGDFVWLDAEAHIHYVGRRDGQFKFAGARIELHEVENALSNVTDGLLGAVGVVRRDGKATELIAFVVAAPEELRPTEWLPRLRKQLPHAAVPKAFVPLPQLPTLANGKLDRHALNHMATERSGAESVAKTAP